MVVAVEAGAVAVLGGFHVAGVTDGTVVLVVEAALLATQAAVGADHALLAVHGATGGAGGKAGVGAAVQKDVGVLEAT